MNTFIRQKAEETDRQAGRQTNKQTNNDNTIIVPRYYFCLFRVVIWNLRLSLMTQIEREESSQ